MNFADHVPAHFHAWYNEYKAIISIKDGVVKGEMPGRALKMILEWLEQHKDVFAGSIASPKARAAVLQPDNPVKHTAVRAPASETIFPHQPAQIRNIPGGQFQL